MQRSRSDQLDALLLSGDDHPDDPLARALIQVRSTHRDGPPPAVGNELQGVFRWGASGLSPIGPVPPPRSLRRALRPARSRRWILIGTVGVAAITTAGGAGALPAPAQDAFDRGARAVGFERVAANPAESDDEVVPDADDLTPTGSREPAPPAGTNPPDPSIPATSVPATVAPPPSAATLPEPAPIDRPPATDPPSTLPPQAPEPPDPYTPGGRPGEGAGSTGGSAAPASARTGSASQPNPTT